MKIKYIPGIDSRVSKLNKFVEDKYPQLVEEENPDVILVAGGDGAMLHAMQGFMHLDKPFLGIAAGTFNFLMNEVKDGEEFIDKLIAGSHKLHYLETKSINIEITSNTGGICFRKQAVNDVVIGNMIMQYHHLSINSERRELKDFVVKGSGIAVSTALGSTAFNLNNGGNVLPLNSDLWNITDIVCNKKLNDVFIPQRMEIELLSDRSEARVYVDGIDSGSELHKGDFVVLSPGKRISIAFVNEGDLLQKRIELSNRHRKDCKNVAKS